MKHPRSGRRVTDKMEMQVVLWAKSLPDTIIIGWVPHTASKGHLVFFWDFGQGKCQWMSSLNKQNRNSGCVQCHLRWLRAVYTCPIDTKSCSLWEMNHLIQTWNKQFFNLGVSICIYRASVFLWYKIIRYLYSATALLLNLKIACIPPHVWSLKCLKIVRR